MPNLPTSLHISADETYMELTHGLNQWPALVNVRANLLDGPFAGWYSDGQGKMSLVVRKLAFGFQTRSLTNRDVQPLKTEA